MMMMSSSSLSKYVVFLLERQVFARKFVRLGKSAKYAEINFA